MLAEARSQFPLTRTTNVCSNGTFGPGSDWFFYREFRSSQRESAPDIRILQGAGP
jgi:hypothetical protein